MASDSSKLLMILSFVANILLSASLNQLWSLINTQQLIVLMPLFRTNIPANAVMFFNKIMEIAAFEILDLAGPLDDLLDLESQEPENPQFVTLGLESIYLVNNMGTLFLAYVVWLLAAIFALFLNLLSEHSKRANNML